MRGKWVSVTVGLVMVAGGGAFVAAQATHDDHAADRARGEQYALDHYLSGTSNHVFVECVTATRALYYRKFASGAARPPADAVAFFEGCSGRKFYYEDD